MAEEAYKAAGDAAQGGPGAAGPGAGGEAAGQPGAAPKKDDVVDAEFEEQK